MIELSLIIPLLFLIAAAPVAVGVIAWAWTPMEGGTIGPVADDEPPPGPLPQAAWISSLQGKAPPREPEQRIGLILVHGIGEQRRFQHLDSQLRDLIRALRSLERAGRVQHVSVDIAGSGAAAFSAEHDTWTSGPGSSVTIVVDHTLNGVPQRARLLVHEVWWADVNEPYSLAKQFRFWLWGLAIWAIPARPRSNLAGADRVAPPFVERRKWWWDRVRLWGVGTFFMLLGYSVGAISFVLSRLFNLQTPSLLRTISNYISAVKLYNQQRRYGVGLLWKREEFLDSIQEPPRVSIRRRMIRAIADVATNRYHRWYVLAHSQGTVVAFNGLMDTAWAWPGYLDEKRWETLRNRHMAGPAAANAVLPIGRTMPRRPGWAGDRDIAYRSRIFSRFRGFLTYGSPLQKFAGLWPALVPISKEGVFDRTIPWVSVYDPLDPVSGRLDAFKRQPPECCPQAVDFGYTAHWGLLVAHLRYLTRRRAPETTTMREDVATRAMRWILTDDATSFVAPAPGWARKFWFARDSRRERNRSIAAWTTWFIAVAILMFLGAIVLPVTYDGLRSAFSGIASAVNAAL